MQTESPQAFKERAARSLLNHPVTCTMKGTGATFQAVCVNVSQSGMLLGCEAPPEAGTDIDFAFIEHGIVLIRGEARVARIVQMRDGLGAGVFFTQLDGSARRLIDRVIELNSDAARAEADAMIPAAPDAGGLSLDMD